MKALFFVCVALAALALLYVMWLRKWLKTKRWADGFFKAIEPFEIALYKKSETLLLSRSVWVGSAMVTAYDSVAVFATSLDLTPLTSRLLKDIPEDLRGLVISALIGGLGLLIGWLRKRTTTPIEIVALAEADMTPKIAQAVAVAEEAKIEAVAVVAEAKT